MTLLELYLRSVALHLPKDSEKADILSELAEHLQSKMEEREEELGRPLTELERQTLLAEHGDPVVVASRYGKKSSGFTFGPWEVVSARMFPVYAGLLAVVITLTVISSAVEAFLTGTRVSSLLRHLLVVIPLELAGVTAVLAGVDFFLRRAWRESWLFWTPYLKRTPRWYSASGLIFLALVGLAWGLWWGAWPEIPAMFLGPAARGLEPSPTWQRFVLPLLALVLLGIAHRAVSLARPRWTWLPPTARLAINVFCVAMLYPMWRSAPFVTVSDVVARSPETVRLAASLNDTMLNAIRSIGSYWVLNTLWIAFVCLGFARHAVRRRNERATEESSR